MLLIFAVRNLNKAPGLLSLQGAATRRMHSRRSLLGSLPLASIPTARINIDIRGIAPATARTAGQDELVHVGSMHAHHGIERNLGAADHRTEALFADFGLELGIVPAGVIVSHVHLRVGAVPRRQALIDIAPDRSQGAGDKVDDTRKFGFAI